ncbi:MAG: hypothetical protein HOL48_07660 [Porticoccaceae bacterium]|jgi:hypothetical protein|nr:hypothetical protein [Porticoccaceae bacterium]
MEDKLILYPIFSLLALTLFVMLRTFMMRVKAVKSGEISHKYYRLYNQGTEPAVQQANTRHLTNLMEVPPLFYITCILIYVTGINSLVLLICAWLFVLSRFIHSYVHLGKNRLKSRYKVFFASVTILVVMWAICLTKIVQL